MSSVPDFSWKRKRSNLSNRKIQDGVWMRHNQRPIFSPTTRSSSTSRWSMRCSNAMAYSSAVVSWMQTQQSWLECEAIQLTWAMDSCVFPTSHTSQSCLRRLQQQRAQLSTSSFRTSQSCTISHSTRWLASSCSTVTRKTWLPLRYQDRSVRLIKRKR